MRLFSRKEKKCFNPRKVRTPKSGQQPVAARSLSNHSFGAAIDFNPGKNPYKAGNPSEMERYPQFIEAFERNGFTWLGDGAGRSGRGHPGDDMHFHINYDAVEAEQLNTEQDSDTDTEDVAGYYSQFGAGQAQQNFTPATQPNMSTAQPAMTRTQESIKRSLDSLLESLDKNIFTINDETEEKIYHKYKKYFDSLK